MTDPHEQLWAAIEQLTNPTRDNQGTIPSLWDQLQQSIDTTAGNGGGRGKSPQLPLNTAVLSLIDEIQRDVAQELRSLGLDTINRLTKYVRPDCRCRIPYSPCKGYKIVARRRRDIPAELRLLNEELAQWPADRIEWAKRITTWCQQATLILTPPEHITMLRGQHCIDCQARTVTIWNDGEYVVQPALRLIWDDNPDPETSQVDFIHCQNCGRSRWHADLHAIAEHTAMLNLATETLTSGVLSAAVDETRPHKVRTGR